MLLTLDEIAIKHGTDKATVHPGNPHCYTPHYERYFDALKYEPIRFIEIGVGGGESIQTWLDYFPRAKVYGVDIVRDTNPWNTPIPKAHVRYQFVCGSQSDPTFWKCFAADHGGDWDVVVDDGGHTSEQIITTFNGLWHAVKPGGLYCIEDLGVAYGVSSVFLTPNWPGHLELLRQIMDDINLKQNNVAELHLSNELAIIRKGGISAETTPL